MKENTVPAAWVDPEVKVFDIERTQFTPDRGADGETRWIDCTS